MKVRKRDIDKERRKWRIMDRKKERNACSMINCTLAHTYFYYNVLPVLRSTATPCLMLCSFDNRLMLNDS
jgi:hypothetical protein